MFQPADYSKSLTPLSNRIFGCFVKQLQAKKCFCLLIHWIWLDLKHQISRELVEICLIHIFLNLQQMPWKDLNQVQHVCLRPDLVHPFCHYCPKSSQKTETILHQCEDTSCDASRCSDPWLLNYHGFLDHNRLQTGPSFLISTTHLQSFITVSCTTVVTNLPKVQKSPPPGLFPLCYLSAGPFCHSRLPAQWTALLHWLTCVNDDDGHWSLFPVDPTSTVRLPWIFTTTSLWMKIPNKCTISCCLSNILEVCEMSLRLQTTERVKKWESIRVLQEWILKPPD